MVGNNTASASKASYAICVYWALLAFVAFAPITFALSRNIVLGTLLVAGLPFTALAVAAIRIGTRDAELAHRDELTGLPNRRAFVQEARTRLEQAKAGSLALVLLDIDGLKITNDDCGHAAGDELLAHAGSHLASLRCDAYRIGGDEFGLVVDRSREETVTTVLRKLEPFGMVFDTCGHEHTIRLSYGYASCRADDRYEDIFGRADSRLRQFKRRLYKGGHLQDRRSRMRVEHEDDELAIGRAPILSIEERRRRRDASGLTLLS